VWRPRSSCFTRTRLLLLLAALGGTGAGVGAAGARFFCFLAAFVALGTYPSGKTRRSCGTCMACHVRGPAHFFCSVLAEQPQKKSCFAAQNTTLALPFRQRSQGSSVRFRNFFSLGFRDDAPSSLLIFFALVLAAPCHAYGVLSR